MGRPILQKQNRADTPEGATPVSRPLFLGLKRETYKIRDFMALEFPIPKHLNIH